MWYTSSMKIVYQIQDVCDYIGATVARCELPLFGRWCELTITAYCLGENPWDATAVACSYGVRPLKQNKSNFDATNGVLCLARGEGTSRQNLEQFLEFPTIIGEFFDKQTVSDGGVSAARDLIRGILRGTESMIETIRQSIRCGLSDNVRDLALQNLDSRFGKITKNTIEHFLGEINWHLMFSKSGCDEHQFNCIEYMAEHNPPKFYSIAYNNESDIPLVGEKVGDVVKGMKEFIRLAQAERRRAEQRQAQLQRDKDMAKANDKAKSLLQQICGEKLAREFDLKGSITVEQDGYIFEIPSNSFIHCTDPNGKKSDLCIHSRGFQVNPIDEIILAYLHIKHKLVDYMKVAILHGAEYGFKKKIIKNT